jgi:hypothetical protein
MAIRKIVSRAISPAYTTVVDNQISNATTNPVFSGTGSLTAPKGTTAQRPAEPVQGMLRYNTTLGLYEQYTSIGWQSIDAPPVVNNISGTINENTDSTITVYGSGFKDGSVVYIEGPAVSNVGRALVTTYVSDIQLTASTNSSVVNFVGQGSFDVKVLNPSGLFGVLSPAGNVDEDPIWATSAGTVATIYDRGGSYTTIATLSATDADSSVSYSVVSGSLPAGTSLNSSTGVISGDPDDVGSNTTSNFTVRATSNGQTIDRSFSIIVNRAVDGSSSDRAAANASAIKSVTGTTTNGLYWINWNGTPIQVYCDMSTDGGGWMLTFRCKNYNNQGCGQGVWDFPLILGAGGSSPPTSPIGNLSGNVEGWSPSNRWSFWQSTGASTIRSTKGDGSTINLDVKWNAGYSFDTSNMWYYAATGAGNTPGSNYSNQWVPSTRASDSGPGDSLPVYVIAATSGLTAGQSYGVYSHGHYTCGCCEEYVINGSGEWNPPSGSKYQLFGDGYSVSQWGGTFGGPWTSFWIK